MARQFFGSQNTRKIFFAIVIGFISLAFIFSGFGRFHVGSLFGGIDKDTAVIVGNKEVSMSEFANLMSRYGGSSKKTEERQALANQIVNQLISENILIAEAEHLGWTVSDFELTDFIRSYPEFQDPKTRQFSYKIFQDYSQSMGATEDDFYKNIREKLEIQKVQNLLFMPSVIPDAVAQIQNELDHTDFVLSYAEITSQDHLSSAQNAAALSSFLKLPENVKAARDFYKKHLSQFHQKAQTNVASILISYKGAKRPQGEGLLRTKSQALLLAQKLAAGVNSGQKFSVLATQANDDAVAKAKGGDLGAVDDSNLDPTSLKVVQGLTMSRRFSGVVSTPFGYRLFYLLKKTDGYSHDFESVKKNIAQGILERQGIEKKSQKILTEVRAALAKKDVAAVNSLLQKNGIDFKKIDKPFRVTDPYIAKLGPVPQLKSFIFALKKNGDIAPQIYSVGGKNILFRLESRTRPLALTAQNLSTLKRGMMGLQSQEFYMESQSEILKRYQEEGKIKVNPVIRTGLR